MKLATLVEIDVPEQVAERLLAEQDVQGFDGSYVLDGVEYVLRSDFKWERV